MGKANDNSKGGIPVNSSLFRLLKRVPQFTRMGRHFATVIKHSTFKKILNLLLVEIEYRLRRLHLYGRPYIIIIDPLNVCNLRCPLCPTGTGVLSRKQQGMSWDIFTKVIDEVAPYAYEVNLHNWGESLLHPHIFEMIEYIHKKNIATNMSSNFNLIKDEKIDRLIKSGLEYLILSIDGVSQESYQKYRIGGDFDRVMKNVAKLIERRRELNSSTPYIEWQFIVFKHNVSEVDTARKLAQEMGIDRFRVIPPGLPFAAKEPELLKKKWFVPKAGDHDEVESFREQAKIPCFYLYRSYTINPDGGTAPCCIVYGEDNDFGDTKQDSFKNIWNNKKYHSARSLFRKDGKATVSTVCDGCTLFCKHGQSVKDKIPKSPKAV